MEPYPASAGAIVASTRTIAAIPAKISRARRIVPVLLVGFPAGSGVQHPVRLSVAVAAAQDTFARRVFLAVFDRAKLNRIARRTDVAAPGAALFSGGKRGAPAWGHRDHNFAVCRI